jgi:uncharacterized membrane protein required for colicin V production
MDLSHLPINWFDMVAVVVLLIGLNLGRKHGMSVEMMVSLQWLAMIVAGAYFYRPLGDWLSQSSPLSHLFCYIAVYLTVAVAVKMVFGMIKKSVGGKLVGSNVFGGAEYYLGMVAGTFRFACILIAALALLNAPFYSPKEIAARRAFQNDVYGSNFFPELPGIQQEVFKHSLLGCLIKERAGFLLITSTKPEKKEVKRLRERDDLQ